MSETPTSLRNIPPDALKMAQEVSGRLGLSVSDVLRLSLVTGTPIELVKAGPDQAGTYGGFPASYLASLLRRQLAAAIDFLLEHGQHPYQAMYGTNGSARETSSPVPPPEPAAGLMFDEALEEELEGLGIGLSFSSLLNEPVGVSS